MDTNVGAAQPKLGLMSIIVIAATGAGLMLLSVATGKEHVTSDLAYDLAIACFIVAGIEFGLRQVLKSVTERSNALAQTFFPFLPLQDGQLSDEAAQELATHGPHPLHAVQTELDEVKHRLDEVLELLTKGDGTAAPPEANREAPS